MKRTSLLRSVFIGLILLCAADPPTTVAQSDAEMERKVITWVIPFKDGGGSDTWARFNAPFLSRHLPGSPEIVVRNVPGGGSTKGANLYAQSARPNGLTLLGTSASTQFPFLLGDSRVRYDYSQWTVLMVYPTGGVVYASPELGIKNARDLTQLSKQKLTYASQGTTSSDLVALLGLELLGINVRPIFGIRGGGGKRLAFMRGDTTIDFQTSTAYLRDVVPMVKDGRAVPLFSFGVLDANGALIRDPNFPDLPNIAEVYRDVHKRDPGGLAWDSWFAFFTAGFGAQKLLVLPKDTRPEIIESYRNAVNAMLADPEFQAAQTGALGSYKQVGGQTAQRLYTIGTNMPDESRRWIRNWLLRRYNVKLR